MTLSNPINSATAAVSGAGNRLIKAHADLRVWSLVITFFGDSIVPRGGEVWLGTLSTVMRGLGIDEQAVRAAVSRLTRDGWLARERIGRNSFYRLLEEGNRDFSSATDLIYGAGPRPFNGRVTMITGGANGHDDTRKADDLKIGALLTRYGWGSLAAHVRCAFDERDCPQGAGDHWIRIVGGISRDDAIELVSRAWDLSALEADYQGFLTRFELLRKEGPQRLDPLEALMARTLLIHAFRRIVLRDPLLPPDVLSPEWPGRRARDLVAVLYRSLSPEADRWLDENGVGSGGKLPKMNEEAGGRFAYM